MSRTRRHAKISLRICLGDEIALGPGKADVLDAIDTAGTIAGAGRLLGMSYKRAWNLVETMNRCFKSPLVETSKGGASRGGASLSPLGRAVLERYRSMEDAAKSAVRDDARYIESQLVR
jgi:molybdate transport system regulatory protein